MSAVQEARQLLQDTDASVSDLQNQRDLIRARRGQVISRLMLIAAKPKNAFGTTQPAGRIRRQTLAQGTPEELLELDRECDLLEAEREQLDSADKALDRSIRKREVSEAAENLPALFDELEQTLDAEEAAKEDYAQARGNTDTLVERIRQTRLKATRAEEAPLPDVAMMRRLLKLRGLADLPQERSVAVHGALTRIEDALSVG